LRLAAVPNAQGPARRELDREPVTNVTIDCSFCSHANPDGAKFCNQCASPLHLRPCRLCDAVNVREAEACYRCAAPLGGVAPTTQELVAEGAERSEQIVALAGERLAALARDLGQPVPPLQATTAVDAERPSVTVDSAEPVETTAQADAAVQPAEPTIAGPAYEPEIAAAAQTSVVVDPRDRTHDPSLGEPMSIPLSPDERQWRPARRSRAAAILLALAVIAVPATVYLMRHPGAVDALLAGLRLPAGADRASESNAASPAPVPAAADTAQLPATTPSQGTPAPTIQSTQPPAADAVAPPATRVEPEGSAIPADAQTAARAAGQAPNDSTPAASSPPESADAPPSAPTTDVRPPAEPAAATTRPATRPARAQTTRPRTSPRAPAARSSEPAATDASPPAALAREAPAAAPSPAQRPCTEAVAALGLCGAAR
jgi:hypothetical protein